jgi:hypothetical protein
MEEKIIIKGKFSKTNILMIIFGIVAVIFAIIGCVYLEEFMAYYGFNIYGYGEEYPIFFTIAIVFLVAAIISYLVMNRCEIVVSNKKVFGKVKFGKRVDLPLNQISSVGQGWFKSISVATSSGIIRFWLLSNRQEVFSAISELLSQFQNNNQTVIHKEEKLSSADELKKYKDLLDSGVITQEEFDAKKKQLLGL